MMWRGARQYPQYAKGYLFPFACFDCRRSFKRAYKPGSYERKCPHCGGLAVMLNRKFKAPARDDVKQWKKVRALYDSGFRFESVYGARGSMQYPRTSREVSGFVAAVADEELKMERAAEKRTIGRVRSKRKARRDKNGRRGG